MESVQQFQDVYAVILAGGSGTRFWPVSRQAKPKQFLALGQTKESLIQATARRVSPLLGGSKEHLMVVTNRDLIDQVHEHVPGSRVIAEPFGRNTAASIGLAAVVIAQSNPDAIMVVLPADHSVSDEDILRKFLTVAVDRARQDNSLVTIGIRPDTANTAYGYIQRGESLSSNSYKVARFFEKPSLQRAKDYCAAGNYYWNSGMFVWKASSILEAFKLYMPKLYSALMKIQMTLGKADENKVLDSEFNAMESISIDFGVLEHANNCVVVEAGTFGWNDVGSWDAWAHHFNPDENGNIVAGDAFQVQSKNSIIYNASSGKKVIALLGVENLVVVDTDDALLLCDRSRVQEVKLVVEGLRLKGRDELL